MAKVFGAAILILALIVLIVIVRSDSNPLSRIFTRSSSTFGGFGTSTISQRPSPPAYTPPPRTSPSGGSPPLAQTTSTINPRDIPQGFTLAQLSPYFKKVRIASLSAGSETSYSVVTLRAGISGSSTVNITGWQFKSNRGGQIMPRAINSYDPSGLTSESDIVLKNGDFVRIYSTVSPIGKNLRLNSCVGYLENHLNFNPRLSVSCPQIDYSGISSFTGRCQDYIRSLGSCREPVANPPIPLTDYACRDYVSVLNYRGCYDRHRGDSDFLKNEWRVWTGSKFLDFRHDRVYLFDTRGLLVDAYTY